MSELLTRRRRPVEAQLPQVKEHLAKFGDRLPEPSSAQLKALEERLG